MENVTSRPDVCGDGSSTKTRDNFHQSLAYELIRRPLGGYSGYTRASTTDFYTIDHGPHPADTGVGGAGVDDARDQEITSAVPVLGMSNASDDPGVQRERFYWKADLRIVDGIWTRKDGTVVFNPETWALGTAGAPLDLTDPQVELGYKIARVLRYSWFWDPRESRVYGGSAATSRQRALQIRATDFDVAALTALLEDSDARSLLLPGGLPPQGIIVYLSETYDPVYEDNNTILSDNRRGANVRNYLNFAVMQNHVRADVPTTTLFGEDGNPIALSATPPLLPTPTDLGWWPEHLWGRAAPLGFRSLTLPQEPDTGVNLSSTTAGSPLDASVRSTIGQFYRDPRLVPLNAGTLRASEVEDCYEPSLLADVRDVLPDTRPASFATPAQRPPCIQSGATPMGPENAVRIVRAQTVPAVGLTIASDNRMYIYGDVNVRENSTVNVLDPTGSNVNVMQDIPGKVSFIADSVTILSARFSDRFMQRGGHRDFVALGDLRFNRRARFSATKQAYEAPYSVDTNRPWSHEAEAEDGVNATDLGNAPNLCSFGSSLTAGTSTQTVGALPTDFPTSFASALQSSVSPRHIRQALPTRINASIITGDVPACVDGGTNDGNPSGGMNNLPRFIESWGSFGGNITHNVIYGSLISLYRSERGNARYLDALFNPGTDPSGANWQAAPNNAPYAWSTNPCVYAAPLRVWSFDTALTDPANLPPGTPKVVDTHRLRWVRR